MAVSPTIMPALSPPHVPVSSAPFDTAGVELDEHAAIASSAAAMSMGRTKR
jgi:hypothetical protein